MSLAKRLGTNSFKKYFAKIVFVFSIFIVYIPAIRGGFVWDDDFLVTNNSLLTNLVGLWKIWTTTKTFQYYPIVFSSFWIERHLWGLNPLGFHIVNVFLHSLNSILLWRLMEKLNVKCSWLVAIIFALHPVHVESVAWISERKNVLSGFFYLLAILKFIEFEESKNLSNYILSLFLFIFALLSKTVTSTLPAVLILLHWYRNGTINLKYAIRLVPFFTVGIGLGLVTVLLEKHHVGANGYDWNLSLLDHIILAGRILCFYVAKLVWPQKLAFIYSRWTLNPNDFGQWIPFIVFSLIALILWRMLQKIGRGPFTCLAYFAGTLFPALGFFNVYPMRYSFVADHFQYLASIGIITLFVQSGAYFVQRFETQLSRFSKIATGVVIVILGTLTWSQAHIYKDPETLWQDTLKKDPKSFLAHNNLGIVYYERKEYDKALKLFFESLQLDPKNIEIYNNIGVIYYLQNNYSKAEDFFKKAIEINPNYSDAHNNLGGIYYSRKEYEKALKEFEFALQTTRINAESIQHNIEILKKLINEKTTGAKI